MRYRFASFELDTARHEFYAGGNPVALEPQVFDVLSYLVENHDRMISRDELIKSVWGGRVVSDATVSVRINAVRRALGDSGTAQSFVKTIPRRGFRFVAKVTIDEAEAPAGGASSLASDSIADSHDAGVGKAHARPHEVRFCHSADGTRIAFSTAGRAGGPPLVKIGHWMSHLELDWHRPVSRLLLDELGQMCAITRYDQRSQGLSDWSVQDFSLNAFVNDLQAVVDAAGLDSFALYGASQGTPIGIAFAARHPDRVRGLNLQGGYVRGRMRRQTADETEQGEALVTLMRYGWGKLGSPFVKAYTSMYMPTATREQIAAAVELQKQSATPENAVKLRIAFDNFDVSDQLDKVECPTLVIHSRNDGIHPLDQGRELAAGIANSNFVLLESENHILLPDEPAWPVLISSMKDFILRNA